MKDLKAVKAFKLKAIEGVYLPFIYAKGFDTFQAPSVAKVDEKLEKEGIFIKSRAEKLYKKVYKKLSCLIKLSTQLYFCKDKNTSV